MSVEKYRVFCPYCTAAIDVRISVEPSLRIGSLPSKLWVTAAVSASGIEHACDRLALAVSGEKPSCPLYTARVWSPLSSEPEDARCVNCGGDPHGDAYAIASADSNREVATPENANPSVPPSEEVA